MLNSSFGNETWLGQMCLTITWKWSQESLSFLISFDFLCQIRPGQILWEVCLCFFIAILNVNRKTFIVSWLFCMQKLRLLVSGRWIPFSKQKAESKVCAWKSSYDSFHFQRESWLQLSLSVSDICSRFPWRSGGEALGGQLLGIIAVFVNLRQRTHETRPLVAPRDGDLLREQKRDNVASVL